MPKKTTRQARTKPRRPATKSATKKPKVQASPTTKTGTLLDLLQRPTGASLTELMTATGWQAHSVRGFLSGTVKRRLGHTLKVETAADGRRYRIQNPPGKASRG